MWLHCSFYYALLLIVDLDPACNFPFVMATATLTDSKQPDLYFHFLRSTVMKKN